jgi:hypothetical protein
MRFKGTLILLVVCLALGSYLYFYEIKGGEQRDKAKEAEGQLWKLESNSIQQIDLISPKNNIVVVRNGEKDWTISAPRTLNADADELNRLANAASNIRRESVLEQNAADLSKFGLDPAQLTLKLKAKDSKEYALNIGNNNPTGSFAYATASGRKEVFLVSSSLRNTFDKRLNELRNQSILSFEQPETQSLRIRNPKGEIQLIKDGSDRWWIEGKEKVAADSPEIRGILNALSLGKIKEFFDENPEEYSDLGIDKPLIDVTLTYGKNKAIKHLVIGKEKNKLQKKGRKSAEQENKKQASGSSAEKSSAELYLAKDESRPDLFFAEKDLVDKLTKSVRDLRDKALASFQRWDIDSIDLKNTKGSFSFIKSGGEWFLGADKKKTKWEAVNGILDAMEKPIVEWIDTPSPLSSYGLDKPAIHIVLKQGGNEIIDCSLGKAAKNGVYAQLKGNSSVKIASPEDLSAMDKGEPDFIEPAPAPAPKK